MPVKPSVPDMVPVRPVEPDPTPRPSYKDPYAGVVTGPLLVERTRWCQAWHRKRYGDDKGRPLPIPEESWEDAWGKHTLKDGTLTTDYAQPAPVAVVSKRKHRRP